MFSHIRACSCLFPAMLARDWLSSPSLADLWPETVALVSPDSYPETEH